MKMKGQSQGSHSLDEGESYFSYLLSPLRKPNHKVGEIAVEHGGGRGGGGGSCGGGGYGKHERCQGDVDCEAELFIRHKHKKLELSKTMPSINYYYDYSA